MSSNKRHKLLVGRKVGEMTTHGIKIVLKRVLEKEQKQTREFKGSEDFE